MPIWTDSLIWCPSQCYAFDEQPDGTFTCLYLRWRWEDPWQACIIKGVPTNDPRASWPVLDFGPDVFENHGLFFYDFQLALAKSALLYLYKTGEAPKVERND